MSSTVSVIQAQYNFETLHSPTMSRSTSPGPSITRPFRFSSQNTEPSRPLTKVAGSKGCDIPNGGRARRDSKSTTKVAAKEKSSVDSVDSSSAGYGPDPFAANYNPSSSFTSYDSFPSSTINSRPSTAHDTATLPKRSRGSILVAASDALNFKFGRKRKPVRPQPMPLILPDVIEISAPRRDDELEERERLRDAAAQSIGLGPEMPQEAHSVEDSLEEEVEPDEEADTRPHHTQDDVRSLDHNSINGRPTFNTSFSGPPSSSLPVNGRLRSGSLAHSMHSRTNSRSLTPTPIPAFPSTPGALTPLIQNSSTLPKYYSPSSLRIFALSKHWKTRFMILSSPACAGYRGSAPTVSYLHLFKSSGSEDKELERLEINENSVVFVADEEVGGRRNVVKVGGQDVGALRKDYNHEEGGRTMWFLQIINAAEAQKWIAVIKNAILGQRSMRAGLGIPANLGGIEPRGDMDVMLLMRAQGLIPSPTQSKFTIPDFNGRPPTTSSVQPLPIAPDQDATESSSRSVRSQSTGTRSPQGTAVSALKGLFSGSTRPRSPSRATSIEQERAKTEDSFGNMGNNLLNMLRANGTGDGSLSVAASPVASPKAHTSSLPRFSLPATGLSSPEKRLDRRIIPEPKPVTWPPGNEPTDDRPSRALSIGSLNPPPRKRPWTSLGPSASSNDSFSLYKHSQGNDSIAGSFGVGSVSDVPTVRPPASPAPTGNSFGAQGQQSRAPSVRSISTFASAENTGVERTNSTKRWSRQGTLLPKRLTPPSGPPPSVPLNASSTHSHNSTPRGGTPQHPYAMEGSRSRSSSVRSGASPKTVVSSLPSFKRTSGSSAFSVSSFSSSQSRTNGGPVSHSVSSHRASMPPPPRPAPNFAPPPVPSPKALPKQPDSVPQPKSSFRDSVAQRALRLSLIAPKPPPSTVLPPRPDEATIKSHRRTSSGDGSIASARLYAIPASPPPNRPLPMAPSTSAPSSRHTSIKQRLRILSAPSPTANPSFSSQLIQSDPSTPSPYPSTTEAYSPPATPIGEHIMTQQNDFLSLYSPTTPTMPITVSPLPRTLDHPSHEDLSSSPELTSLSPPPRRISRQTVPDKENTDSVREDRRSSAEGEEKKLLTLSQQGSVVSLGFVSV